MDVQTGNPPFRYEWDVGDGTIYETQSIMHLYAVAGNYTVSLTVKDVDGDLTTHTFEVEVLPVQTSNNTDDDDDDSDGEFNIYGYSFIIIWVSIGGVVIIFNKKVKK